MKKVTFSKIVREYNYTQNKCDSFLERTNTPNIINRLDYKSDIIEIFKETMEKGFLIVCGNLGRHPYLLEYYLDIYFDSTQKVHVQSYWWDNLNIDSYYKDNETPCDMLIMVEPTEKIIKPSYAKSLLVLTSFPIHPTKYKYLGNFDKVKQVINKFTQLKHSHTHVFVPPLFCTYRLPYFPQPHVSLDLSQCQSKDETFLCLLNMIDYLSNLEIKSWTVTLNKQFQYGN